MLMKRLLTVRTYLLLLLLLWCAGGVGLDARVMAQEATKPDALLLGVWSGRAHYGDESKPYAVRFEIDKKDRLVMFYYSPDMKFHNIGPFALKQEGDEYKNPNFSFRLSPDKQSLAGAISFDGHDLPLELKRGGFFAIDRNTGKVAWRFPMVRSPASWTTAWLRRLPLIVNWCSSADWTEHSMRFGQTANPASLIASRER